MNCSLEMNKEEIMSKEEIKRAIYTLVSDKMKVPEETIAPTSAFDIDLGADTLDVVELIVEVEERFGLAIPDCDCEKLTTVGRLVDYVVHQLS